MSFQRNLRNCRLRVGITPDETELVEKIRKQADLTVEIVLSKMKELSSLLGDSYRWDTVRDQFYSSRHKSDRKNDIVTESEF